MTMVVTLGICSCFVILVMAQTTPCCTALGPGIFVAPEPVNTTLNTTAVFNCTVNNGLFGWYINGDLQSSPEAKARGIDVTSPVDLEHGTINSTLTIPATMDSDNITIACQAAGENGVIRSPVVLLRVQSLLDPPGTLTVMNTNSGDIKLTWTPPFTLDITDVDPDISNYTVYIINTNTSNTGTVSVTELDGNGVVKTEYTFTGLPGEDPDPCHVYQFSVSAWNVVGEGERSEPVEGWFLGAPLTIVSLTVKISLHFGKQPNISSLLKVDNSCPGRLPVELKYRVVSATHAMQDFVHSTDGTLECSISENVFIKINTKYSVEVTAKNDMGSSLSVFRNFSTFDVQTAVIETTPDTGTVEATCYFTAGSQAKGCRVDFITQEENTCSMTIDKGSGPQAKGRFELPDGTYDIFVHDIEIDGSLSGNPAYEHNETVVVQGSSVSECKISDTMGIGVVIITLAIVAVTFPLGALCVNSVIVYITCIWRKKKRA